MRPICTILFPLNNVQQSYYLGRMKSFDLSEVSTHIYNEFVFDHIDHDKLGVPIINLLHAILRYRI